MGGGWWWGLRAWGFVRTADRAGKTPVLKLSTVSLQWEPDLSKDSGLPESASVREGRLGSWDVVLRAIYSLLLELLPLLWVRETVSGLVLRKSGAFDIFGSFFLLERSSTSVKQLHCHRELPKARSRGRENPGRTREWSLQLHRPEVLDCCRHFSGRRGRPGRHFSWGPADRKCTVC